MNTQITRTTQQQSQVANEINLSLNDLAGMADESMTTTEQLSVTNQKLKLSSHGMSEVIGRFKIL